MKDYHYRYFVIRLLDGDNDPLASHVAILLRPGAILQLAMFTIAAHIVSLIVGRRNFHHLEVAFNNLIWLDWQPPESEPMAEYPEAWEQGAITEADRIRPEWQVNGKLECFSVRASADGRLRFVCSHRHSAAEEVSSEVSLAALLHASGGRP